MGTKRRNEMWISNNRVLVGGNKKVTGRNPNFDTEETKVLIALWGDPKVQKTLITTHKKHAVIAKLAEKMREFGYYRSTEEINTRIKNLKCFYNRIKKDMEFGILSEPTWKHYAAMDEIMTRPIFSVRPNEIPKPSLRYRLEEEMKEREEMEKEKGKTIEESNDTQQIESDDDSNEDDDDDDLEDDLDEVSYTQEICNENKISEQDKISETEKEQCHSNDVEETPLIIPKDEPIDVDEELVIKNFNRDNASDDNFPKLPSYSQLGTSSSSNDNKIITTIAGSNNNISPSSTATTISSIKISQQSIVPTPNITTVFATSNQQTAMSSQAGKISLVPTNLLLKPQNQQQIQIRSQPQHRIIYSKPAVQPATTGIVASTAASGGQQVPMKVLFVNTLQKSPGNTNNVQASTIDSQQIKNTTSKVTNLQYQQHITRTITNGSSTSTTSEKRQKLSSTLKPSKEKNLRSLLTHLVRLQTQNLEVTKQRLEIEKERLQFEKNIAEKFLDAFKSQQLQQSVLSNSQQIQSQQSQASSTINDVTIPLLTPKIEKENDGYEK